LSGRSLEGIKVDSAGDDPSRLSAAAHDLKQRPRLEREYGFAFVEVCGEAVRAVVAAHMPQSFSETVLSDIAPPGAPFFRFFLL
jgi:hypothetical protein